MEDYYREKVRNQSANREHFGEEKRAFSIEIQKEIIDVLEMFAYRDVLDEVLTKYLNANPVISESRRKRCPTPFRPRLRSTRLVCEFQQYYSVIRIPQNRLPFLLFQLVRHTHSSVNGVSRPAKNSVGLTGCLADMM